MSSSSVQQEQLPCARSNLSLDHKCSSSTTTWRGGKWTGRNLLLRVLVHPLFYFTYQQLSHYTALLSGPHRIEIEAALTDHGNFPGGQREKLWREFFMDPSQWWDNRSEKTNERYPDFKHKKTREALWLEDRRNPPWVAAEIAAMAPGTVQLNIFSWNQKLTKYVKDGQLEKAMQLFRQMQQEGVSPDKFTFVQVVKACGGLGILEDGRLVHKQLIQSGLESDVFVVNSLVDMYAKCGSIEDAWRVFNKMQSRDVVTWTAMISAQVKCGQGQKALELFQQMQEEGVRPNSVTFVGVLNACASVVALKDGRCVHEQIVECGWDSNVSVANSLVDMYAKCGSVEDAWRVFNKMPSRDVVTWTAMLGGCAMHGHGKEALRIFEQMCQEGVEPNDITFICLLSACSHAGLVEEGMRCFSLMSRVYGISIRLEHYTCMVDLLGRAGHLQKAENMVIAMHCKPDVAAWLALVGACRIHGNVEMAERIAKQILEREPENAAAAGNGHLYENVEQERKEKGVKRQMGCT